MEDVFGGLNVQRLKSLCHTDTVEELPPIYQGWTTKKKGEKLHALFQSYVDQTAREVGLQAPFVPTSTLKAFQSFQFYGIDECALGDGILPMAFAPPGGSPTARKQQLEAATAADAYDTLISTSGNSLNLSDALALGKAKGYVPIEWTEAVLQVEGYLPVLATLLGVEHPLVRNYLNGLDRLKRIQLGLRHALVDECGTQLAQAILVYYFQLWVWCWLEEQWDTDATIEVPSFTQEFLIFKMSKNLSWLPVVSDVPALKELKVSYPKSTTNSKGSNGGSSRTNKGTGSSAASTTPQRVENPHRDPRISGAEGETGDRLKSWKISRAMGVMKDKGKGPCLKNHGK